MSPRRKSGLSKDDLEALEHLPAVIRALENLREQHAKVRALMGGETHETAAPRERVLHGFEDPSPADLARGNFGAGLPPPSAILDTPERREYEAAKKAGKQVPPDLVNISEAQRERMAEQKALVQQMRQAKGLPVRTILDGVAPIKSREDLAAAIPEIAGEVVRTEELPTSESGSVGGEEDPEVH